MTILQPAISVNGEAISIAEFEAELARYQQAQTGLGKTASPEQAAQAVRDEFVDTLLLVQGAAAQDFVVDDADLQARIDTLAAQVGGADKPFSMGIRTRIHGIRFPLRLAPAGCSRVDA